MTSRRKLDVTDIFSLCVELLYGRDLEPHDPIHFKVEFEDKRLYARGILQSNGVEYLNLTVHLKMPEPIDAVVHATPRVQFGIPKTDDSAYTIVFVWQGKPRLYRPGYWTQYLQQVVEVMKQERDDFLKYNNIPIDDAALFPEIQAQQSDSST